MHHYNAHPNTTSNLKDDLSVGCDIIYILIQQVDLAFSMFRKGQAAKPKVCNVITELKENDTPKSLHVSNALSVMLIKEG